MYPVIFSLFLFAALALVLVWRWLLLPRAIKKQEQKNARIFKELGKNEAIAGLAEHDPELRENLRTLGVEIKPK